MGPLGAAGGADSAAPARIPKISSAFRTVVRVAAHGVVWRHLARRVARLGARSGRAEGGRI